MGQGLSAGFAFRFGTDPVDFHYRLSVRPHRDPEGGVHCYAECGCADFQWDGFRFLPLQEQFHVPAFFQFFFVDTDGLQCFPVKVFLSEYPVVILIHVFFSDEWLMILFCILFIRPVCFLFSVPAAGFACRPPVRHAGLYCGVCPGFPGSIAAVRNLRSLSGRN